jgi:hypothetical protein
MIRTFLTGAVVGLGLLVVPSLARAVIYSPTQAELLDMGFADFIDNENPDNAALTNVQDMGANGVKYTFDTDYDINDDLWRMALEYQNTSGDWPRDLSSYDDFRIDFLNPVPVEGVNLSAQIYLRSVNGQTFVGGFGAQQLNSSFPITLAIPMSAVIDAGGDPADITTFGIEFFGGDEFLGGAGQMASARTSPQPPNLTDSLKMFSWETPDNPGTAGVDERFEGWTTGNVHPDHQHFISTTGATDGTHALQIVRTVTGDDYEPGSGNVAFRWGSSYILDANAGGGGAATGDYNNDGTVNAADYTTWRDAVTAGATTLTNRDPGNMGAVDDDDFQSWRDNYGATGAGPDQATLDKIATIVDAVNDPNAYSISFDLTIVDNFPDPNPSYASFSLAIAASDNGTDVWWQSDVNASLTGLESNGSITQTLDFPLAQFDNVNENGVQSLKAEGLDPLTQYLNIHLATNTNAGEYPTDYSFYIDNFRIRAIVPEEGAGSAAAAVPEPATSLLALLGLIGGVTINRRHS